MTEMRQSLAGKTVLITGAARRIGAVVAETLHREGMNILLHYRNSATQAEQLRDKLTQRRDNSVVSVCADLLNIDALESVVAQALASWGRLDALINNASSFYPTAVGEITQDDWENLMGTNLKAPLFLSQAAAPYLQAQSGCIINIVDIHADRPLKGYPVYCLAKAGLAMLTKSMARELAPEVRVNGIAPGAILWPEIEAYEPHHQEIIEKTALKRQGHPEDIARTALFLMRDAHYVTGQIIAVEGGRTLSN